MSGPQRGKGREEGTFPISIILCVEGQSEEERQERDMSRADSCGDRPVVQPCREPVA